MQLNWDKRVDWKIFSSINVSNLIEFQEFESVQSTEPDNN